MKVEEKASGRQLMSVVDDLKDGRISPEEAVEILVSDYGERYRDAVNYINLAIDTNDLPFNMIESKETIEITEDVRVPGTDIILEKGDRIEVLNERLDLEFNKIVMTARQSLGSDRLVSILSSFISASDDEQLKRLIVADIQEETGMLFDY